VNNEKIVVKGRDRQALNQQGPRPGMAIFGRSKKKQSTTTTTSPQQPPPPVYSSQPSLQALYGNGPHQTSAYVQRPNTSHGHGLPPTQGWAAGPPPYQPVFVTQNYILPPPQQHRPSKSTGAISKLKLSSMSNLLSGDVPHYVPGARIFNSGFPALQQQGTQYLNQGAALCDLISSKFDAVITQIDGERFSGDEAELVVYEQPQPMWQQERDYTGPEHIQGKSKGMVNNSVSSALVSTNYFAKVNLYANSRLPPNLPPMKLYVTLSFISFNPLTYHRYMPTFPLLCLAAQYSERVYTRPAGQEKETHVDSDWRTGTKAMVIKSVPMDDMNTIVFAIRGTQTFMDWAVNLNSTPASPDNFLVSYFWPVSRRHTRNLIETNLNTMVWISANGNRMILVTYATQDFYRLQKR
jgi:hypothetical protein